jgi:hypothetical protein
MMNKARLQHASVFGRKKENGIQKHVKCGQCSL